MRALFILTIIFLPAILLAQTAERQVIGTAGAYAEAGGVSHSYTVGEMATAALSDGTIILTQGFQQSDDLSVSIDEPELAFSATAFPNPTMDGVTLNLNADQAVDLHINLFDALGKQFPVAQSNLQFVGNSQRHIDLAGFASGTYFIRLTDETGQLNKTIQIQKVN